jgi:hypothetical protein
MGLTLMMSDLVGQGDFRGQGMTPGTYVWMAEVNGCDGRSVLLKGDISLVR